MTVTRDEANDFLFGSGAKSFPFEKVGDLVSGEIVGMQKRQQTSLDDGKPLYWDNGEPRMLLVVSLQTEIRDDDEDDGLRSIYVRGGNFTIADGKGTSMLIAVRDAVKRSGATGGIEVGGTLAVQYSGNGTGKRGFNAPKLYSAVYKPPAANVDLDELV